MTIAASAPVTAAAATPAGDRARWLLPLLALAFPVVVWALGTLFFGGDIGKYCDDYLWNRRDLATGALDRFPIVPDARWPRAWRPLHMWWLYNAHSVFWNHDWVLHVFGAAVHLLGGAVLWRFLRRVCRSERAPAAAALLFLACPVAFDAMFWCSTPGTAIATATLMLLWMLYVRWAQGGVRAWVFAPAFVVAYTIPCWNEQPAAMLPALPLLYLALCPAAEPWRKRLVRAFVPAVWLSMSAALYVVVLVATINPGARGGASSFTPPSKLDDKLLFNGGQVWRWFTLRDFWPGALRTGWEQFTASGGAMIVWLALLGVSGAAYFWWWFFGAERRGAAPGADVNEPSAPLRRGWLALFGLAGFAGSWVPFLTVEDQWVASRMMYPMLASLAVTLAAGLDWVFVASARARWASFGVRLLIGAATLAMVGFGALVLIGVQEAYRSKYHLDIRQGEQLRTMVPSPEPMTVFVALRDDSRGVRTGSSRFDNEFLGTWEFGWLAGAHVREVYRRRDVLSSPVSRWVGPPMKRIDDRGVLFRQQLSWDVPPPNPGEGWMIGWDKIIPFVLSPEGDAALVTRIVLERPDNRDVIIVPPQVAAAREARPDLVPERVWTLGWTIDEGESGKPMRAWRWGSGGEDRPLKFNPVRMGTRRYEAVSVHPAIRGAEESTRTDELVLRLGPSRTERKLCLRAGYADWQLENAAKGDGVEFVFSLMSAPEKELARVKLDAAMVRERAGWVPITVPIPPLTERDRLVMKVLPGEKGDTRFDGCMITSGTLFPADDAP